MLVVKRLIPWHTLGLTLFLLLMWPGMAAADPGAPFGVGDSAGNIRLNSKSPVAIRWVAKSTGTLSRLWVKTRTVTHGGAEDSSYYAGTTGEWQVRTYLTNADGTPDLSRPLVSEKFVPAARMASDDAAFGDPEGEAIGLHLGIAVTRGAEYTTVFQNVDPRPSVNYASLNFLYNASGLQGAQGRDTTSPTASDELYGLDPREAVGGDYDDHWYIPGNNYGAFAKFLPTYVQQYADGHTAGQPYYTAASLPSDTRVDQRYVVSSSETIGSLGAFITATDRLTATVLVNGVPRQSVALSGNRDQFVSAQLATPIAVSPGTVVDITTTTHVSGALKAMYADDVFSRLMDLGTGYEWYFTASPKRTVPLYPIFDAAATSPSHTATSLSQRVKTAPPGVSSVNAPILGKNDSAARRGTICGGRRAGHVSGHGPRRAARGHVVGVRTCQRCPTATRGSARRRRRLERRGLRRAASCRRAQTRKARSARADRGDGGQRRH